MGIMRTYRLIMLAAVLAYLPTPALALDYPHDFATPTATPPRDQPCVYCHTPHNSNPTTKVLWNRNLGDPTSYSLYNSPSMDANLPSSGPSPITLLCLCCHDGQYASQVTMPDYSFHGNAQDCENCHDVYGVGYTRMGDLTNDHPVSIIYSSGDPNLQDVNYVLNNGLVLYDGKVECASCHNVHDNTYRPFLRKADTGSALCYTCHLK